MNEWGGQCMRVCVVGDQNGNQRQSASLHADLNGSSANLAGACVCA